MMVIKVLAFITIPVSCEVMQKYRLPKHRVFMEMNSNISTEQITRAVEELKKQKPGYASMLELYEKIFTAQEVSIDLIQSVDSEISIDPSKFKVENGFPLLSLSQFQIDYIKAEKLLNEICRAINGMNCEISESAATILKAIEADKPGFRHVVISFLEEDESSFGNYAKELGIDKENLGFLIYHSIKPSLKICAEKMSSLLDKDNAAYKGRCPICGSSPALSVFEKEGKRFLICSFCWHKWPVHRIFCPNCGNTDHDTLRYFTFEDWKEYRVDACDKCKKYIKTVDCRNTDRFIYPPLEYISTPHLDIKLVEMGFENDLQTFAV